MKFCQYFMEFSWILFSYISRWWNEWMLNRKWAFVSCIECIPDGWHLSSYTIGPVLCCYHSKHLRGTPHHHHNKEAAAISSFASVSPSPIFLFGHNPTCSSLFSTQNVTYVNSPGSPMSAYMPNFQLSVSFLVAS